MQTSRDEEQAAESDILKTGLGKAQKLRSQ